MRNIVNHYVRKFRQERVKRRRLLCLLLALALLVTTGVSWQLHATGIAMTNETYCGLEEHTHTGDCYEQVLVCGLEECEATEGHTHTEDCYETVETLVCGLEESEGHAHDESCYDEAGEPVCGLEESGGHAHDESCYETEQVLVCEQEESEATEGHTHTEDCYETQLVCTLEEHTHTIDCMVDETADVETASDWEATLPALTGDWATDVVAIAESQLGYTESAANFQLAEDGETRQGYTRYGAWYGNEYGDWDAMFASFCLYYAGVDEDDFPEASGAYAWTAKLDKLGLYDEDAEPAPGDLVFFDTDGDGKADRVGVVTNVTDSTLTAVEGDSDDAVEKVNYTLSDSSILGYGLLPEQNLISAASLEEEDVTVTAYTLNEVKALYAALPTATAIEAMTTSAELYAAYEQMVEAYEAFLTLSSTSDRNELFDYIESTFGRSSDGASYVQYLFATFIASIMRVEGSLDLFEAVDLYNGVGITTTLDYKLTDDTGTVITPGTGNSYTLIVEENYTIVLNFNCAIMYKGVYTVTLPEEMKVTQDSETTLTISYNSQNYVIGRYTSKAGNQVVKFEINDLYNFVNIFIDGNISFAVVKRQDFDLFGDANVQVVLEDPTKGTTVDKSGTYDTAKGKLTWTATLTGHEYSNIPGMALTDTITTPDTHYFSQDDMTSGIVFTARHYGNGLYSSATETYVWTVTDGDPNLTWTDSEWVYTFPTSTFTDDNGTSVTLPVSDATNWVITVVYTSTMIPQASGGVISYSNMVDFDLSSDETTVRPPVEETYINKVGEYVAGDTSTSDDDYIEWTITAVIPAYSGSGTPCFRLANSG